MLTISGVTAVNKVYDGLTSATLTGTPAYIGLQNGETFAVTGTSSASFTSAAVGNSKAVTVTGYTVPNSNYTVTQPTGIMANITAKALTITGPAVTTKTYNKTNAATITGTLSGIIAGDTVTLNGTGAFASANVGTGTAVTSISILAGASASNYNLTQPIGLTANITTRGLTITGLTANN